jgi:tRNA modification GTPase
VESVGNEVDTIAAIATATGAGGISIVRVSGPESLAIADRVFRCRGAAPSHRLGGTFAVGHVMDGEQVLDQAILLIMRGPHSYTCEDVIEIQGHGGSQCARRMLRCVLAAGARMAQPGEFTQRAFLNGRLDLVQAEAVLDLIHARSERAAAAAVNQLEGGLSRDIDSLYTALIAIAADIEATLDFPEDELPDTVMPDILNRCRSALTRVQRLIATWEEGHLLRDGATIVISGKPNVGKSTLLNGLLGRDRAIISATPGTTRDTIEEDWIINGIPVRLIDTAGLRETVCPVEQIGIARTREKQTQADLHLYVLDASSPIDEQEVNRLSTWPVDRCFIILNKSDLMQTSVKWPLPHRTIYSNATQLSSVENIKSIISEHFTHRLQQASRPQAAISERHRRLLALAQVEIVAVIDMLSTTDESVAALASARMRDALDHLGLITGRTYHEELLNTIFSRFCIGK